MILAIYGMGGSGRELYEMIMMDSKLKANWTKFVFIDDTKEEGECLGCRHMPWNIFKEKYNKDTAEVIVAVGEPKDRKMLFEKVKLAGYNFATVISSTANIYGSAKIGEGCVLKENIYVTSNAVIGNNVYVNGGSTIIGHDTNIGDHCQISSNTIISGGCTVGECTYIGLSANIRDHITVGKNCIISMSAAVMKSVADNMIAIGNPARVIAVNESGKVFK